MDVLARIPPRSLGVGLYRSYTAAIDEGWTRWVFDTRGVPYVSLVDSVIRQGALQRHFDAVVIPSMSANAIEHGLSARYPTPYAGGLGAVGIRALRESVESGGTLVALNEATRWAVRAFDSPLRGDADSIDSRTFHAVVRFAFRPQYRGPSIATFPLLFNTLTTRTQ